jgi:hypothetical protein
MNIIISVTHSVNSASGQPLYNALVQSRYRFAYAAAKCTNPSLEDRVAWINGAEKERAMTLAPEAVGPADAPVVLA